MSNLSSSVSSGGRSSGSHSRHGSSGSSDTITPTSIYPKPAGPTKANQRRLAPTNKYRKPTGKRCTLWVHDESFSREEVILNTTLFPEHSVRVGDLAEIRAVDLDSSSTISENAALYAPVDHGSSAAAKRKLAKKRGKNKKHRGQAENGEAAASSNSKRKANRSKCYVFLVKDMSNEQKSKQPSLQISLISHIASNFGFKNRMLVDVSVVDEALNTASHVEVTFRDEYLARSDMWRLATSELTHKSVYVGQKIHFMGTLKAQIRNVYVEGDRVQSAYCNHNTKPIFRSDSARYVLLIQISQEMWDFDSDASGEIMFSKVINGLLPELFERWMDMKARHLVSIVLFTRLQYPTVLDTTITRRDSGKNSEEDPSIQDFYRVVVSDMTSGDWIAILAQLKKEFKVFRRDITLQTTHHTSGSAAGRENEEAETDPDSSASIEAGQPLPAIHGNVLEAVSLAASQFCIDYIDCDLVRTGTSIVVITPGSGIFEVDYKMLKITTENMITNGIAIDLICLSRMPLHSVPLFKYRTPTEPFPNQTQTDIPIHSGNSTPHASSGLSSHETNQDGPFVGSSSSLLGISPQSSHQMSPLSGQWTYAVPHWIDVSFWTGSSPLNRPSATNNSVDTRQVKTLKRDWHVGFVPRVKMYEVQTMGLAEAEMTNLSVPYLERVLFEAAGTVQQHTDNREIPHDRSSQENGPAKAYLKPINKLAKSAFNKFETHRTNIQQHKDSLDWTENYDDQVFMTIRRLKMTQRQILTKKAREMQRATGEEDATLFGTSFKEIILSPALAPGPGGLGYLDRKMKERKKEDDDQPRRKNSSSSAHAPGLRRTSLARQTGSGLRFLGATPLKSIASTEVRPEHARPGLVLKQDHTSLMPLVGSSNTVSKSSSQLQSIRRSLGGIGQINASAETKDLKVTRRPISTESASRPITIRGSTNTQEPARLAIDQPEGLQAPETRPSEQHLENVDVLQAASITRQAGPKFDLSSNAPAISATLPPGVALTPWLTPLNPSNPRKYRYGIDDQFSRWQHLFPRPLKAGSSIKWKSLCSPAAVPLTTEVFPSMEQLTAQYSESIYHISQNDDDEGGAPTARGDLLRELISVRLTHGFQMVIGSAVAEALGQPSLRTANLFDNAYMAKDGALIVLSMGNTIHQLQCIDGGDVEIKRFVRKPSRADPALDIAASTDEFVAYHPVIKTALATRYHPLRTQLGIVKADYNWNYVDSFIAGYEDQFTENLRFWRARFVLIPVDQPSANRRLVEGLNEDDDEEIRLEGIRKLTQMWQRYRHVSAEDIQLRGNQQNTKDTNPLDIVYQTRDSSAVVAAVELDSLLLLDNDASRLTDEPAQVADSFQRASINLATLAQEIQGELGVTMRDRRWHWRLHYNCFIGFEMTTWLLERFNDVKDRAEAVELGNELMSKGLFQHVEKRHQFRDGNFFYQVASEYRAPRPESRRGWFSTLRSDKSVPSTPMSESTAGDSPGGNRAPSSSSNDDLRATPSVNSSGSQGEKKVKVALSKVMRFDVDHRKRSYRPELIDLHYDRLHNPDNCYHIRIEWMNVTAKLIEDAIVSWATAAEKHGLRLVEVPIGEASAIADTHPFRSPYLIKLAVQPPADHPATILDSTSFVSPTQIDRHYYHKALLRKLNFVLDFEAARNFPADVDVTYSWGKPDYRFSQYIHRSGTVLAQITDEGDFLLLANRLYNNRTAANGDKFGRADRRDPRPLPYMSPLSSPLVRATPDFAIGSSGLAKSGPGTPQSSSADQAASTAAVRIKDEVEAFCKDTGALEEFYRVSLLAKVTSPAVSSTTSTLDASIPALGLPATVRELYPSPQQPGRSPGGSSPRESIGHAS